MSKVYVIFRGKYEDRIIEANEGVVYLNSAWLREQDKKKAVELFHEYKRDRFIRMFSKLQNYYTDMCILEDIHNGLEV